MQRLATLAGTGWLRTREAGSAVATYRIVIYRRVSGPKQGEIVTDGVLAAEGWVLVVARVEGSAVLVLDTGETVDIRLTRMGASDTTALFILTGELPAF